jgi:hypothetical protein
MTSEIWHNPPEDVPPQLVSRFTSFYEGSVAARVKTIAEVVELESSLSKSKVNFRTKTVTTRKLGSVVKEFIVCILK